MRLFFLSFCLILAGCAALPPDAVRAPDPVLAAVTAEPFGADSPGVLANLLADDYDRPALPSAEALAAVADWTGALRDPEALAQSLFSRSGLTEKPTPPGGDALALLTPLGESLRQWIARAPAIDAKEQLAALTVEGVSDQPFRDLAANPAAAKWAEQAPDFLNRAQRVAAALAALPKSAWPNPGDYGPVRIGSAGRDRHSGGGWLILADPGGDDSYDLPAAVGGARIVFDMGGRDRYRGRPGAAIMGLSAVFDLGGNDRWRGERFALGAAALGVGAIVDSGGDDSYEVEAQGEGLGMAGGVGVLWDRAGDDRYRAGGAEDILGRGGAISAAQGYGQGDRPGLGGGIGLLRDDGGSDDYAIGMFGQGGGYFQGIGLLWDKSGDDRYRAARYAQGEGSHRAAGLLIDGDGRDDYRLSYGVGQGFGLDQSLGLLEDRGDGDDSYALDVELGQGFAEGAGIGALIDGGGRDRLKADRGAWGDRHFIAGLPGFGLALGFDSGDGFAYAGKPWTQRLDAPAGPHFDEPFRQDNNVPPSCPAGLPVASGMVGELSELAKTAGPFWGREPRNLAATAQIFAVLPGRIDDLLDTLDKDDFGTGFGLRDALGCWALTAAADDRRQVYAAVERRLLADPKGRYFWLWSSLLQSMDVPREDRRRAIEALFAHPAPGARIGGLILGFGRRSGPPQPVAPAPAWLARLVIQGTLDRNWGVRAVAWKILDEAKSAAGIPKPFNPSPSFLATRARRDKAWNR